MRIGKLTPDELRENVLGLLKSRRGDVVAGPAEGEDCAAVRAVESLVLLTSDPITGAGTGEGALAVYVNCNDIAASGGEPLGVVVGLLMPPDSAPSDVKAVMADIENAAKNLRIDVLGGHTEFTDAVTRPVIAATAVGTARRFVKSGGAKSGDSIVMTKSAGIEGAYVIAKYFSDRLPREKSDANFLSEKELNEARSFINKVSVLPESRVMSRHEISAMHDVTEGGVYAALAEMCAGCGCGATADAAKIPVLPVVAKMCAALKLDPFGLLSGGSMLCAVKNPAPLLDALRAAGIDAVAIGKFTEAGSGVTLRTSKGKNKISGGADELHKLSAAVE